MDFEIIGEITEIETIAVGKGIPVRRRKVEKVEGSSTSTVYPPPPLVGDG